MKFRIGGQKKSIVGQFFLFTIVSKCVKWKTSDELSDNNRNVDR